MAPKEPDTAKISTRHAWWPLVAILAVGCLLRLLYLLEIKDTPEFSNPLVDAKFHHYWGQAIVTGDWTPLHGQADPQIQTTPFLRPPGYPYFLSAIYRVAGVGYLIPRIVQMTLGLTSCLIAFLLARTWYGHGVGLVLALLMATHWSFIYFEAQLLEPSLLIFLLLSAIFEHSTNSYIFISDGTDSIGANDVLFQLSGVTGLSDTTLTAGNLRIN